MAGDFGTLKGVDSWYRYVWPTGDASGAGAYTNWHNHIHSISATELPTNTWSRYAENEWYLFNGETSQGTNGEEMVEIFRHYGGWREDHILTDSSTSPSGYTLDGSIGWAFKNSGSNRTLIRRFRKEYTATSGYGQAQISGILTVNTTGVVKRIKLRQTNTTTLQGGEMSCLSSTSGVFCFVRNGHDTNTSSTSVGCDDPSDGSYRNFSWNSISGSGSGLITHMQIFSIAGSGGNPNNMQVQYPGTWFNSGGGDFGEGGLYVSGGSNYAVGDVLSPVTTCGSFGTSTASLFEVTEIGSYSTSSVQQNYYDRTDHRCANSDINGIDGWQYDNFQFYAPNVVTGCSDPTANNYSEYANSGDTSTCTYVSAPSISSFTVDNSTPSPGEEFTLSWTIDDGGGTITSLTLEEICFSFSCVIGTTNTILNTYTLNTSDTSYTTSFSVGTAYLTTHRYRLTVVNSEGSDVAEVDVTSSATAPEISNLSVDLSNPVPTQTFTLSWDVAENGASITDTRVTNLTTNTTDILSASATEQSYSFPSGTADGTSWTYKVKVTNDAGFDEKEITVTSALATTGTFTATPTTIIAGADVELEWAIVGTYDSLTIPGVVVDSNPGSAIVKPTTDTTYSMTVTGSKVENGSLTIDQEITVYQNVNINSFVFNKTIITEADTSVTLSWNITGDADTINITPAIPGYTTSTNWPKSDSVTFTYPNTETIYTIKAFGDGVAGSGSINQTASIPVLIGGVLDPITGPSSAIYDIPKRALDVVITLAAAGGGNGGSDAGSSGGGGGNGQGGTFKMAGPQATAYQITLYAPAKGGNGTNNGQVGGGGGAGGGTGYPSGGNGGNSGPSGWSGGGGGGGGAARAETGGNIILVAGGGGGGGGGSWNTGQANSGQNGKSWSIWSDPSTVSSNLHTGEKGKQNPGDGGGGGGGGGGLSSTGDNGNGGSYGGDKAAKAGGGKGGGSYIVAGAVAEQLTTFTNGGAGYGNVTFTYGDWIPNLFSITPQNPTVGGDLPGPGVTVYTDYFTIDGINLPITVDISAGQIQKEGEIAWASSLTVNSGDSIRARFTTPTTGGTANAGYDVVTDLVVRAGLIDDEPDDVVSATWQVTTRSPDIEPDPFGWSDSIENTPFNRIGIESETIVISDFEIPLEIEADYPIEVMINNDGIWRSVSEIT